MPNQQADLDFALPPVETTATEFDTKRSTATKRSSRSATTAPAAPLVPQAASEELLRLSRQLSASVHLGTSSWSFPGWQGLVYQEQYSETELARQGLAAYAAHPVLRLVGIDRSFYQPLTQTDYERYAAQVPPHFRFLVKAPARVADAVLRGERGAPDADNPFFLDAEMAVECFVEPALQGLGAHAGPLVFQLSPLPRRLLTGDASVALIEKLGEFLSALPQTVNGLRPIYAVELRNAELLTPRFVRTLTSVGVRYCLGIHDRMPPAARQSAALRAMDAPSTEGTEWKLNGPLVVRWSLHSGLKYEQARTRYAPFNRLVDPDITSRATLAHLAHVALKSQQPVFITVNNKAEGSAPLSCIALAQAIVGHTAQTF